MRQTIFGGTVGLRLNMDTSPEWFRSVDPILRAINRVAMAPHPLKSRVASRNDWLEKAGAGHGAY